MSDRKLPPNLRIVRRVDGENPSEQYRNSTGMGAASLSYLYHNKPWFTYWDIPLMMRDSWLRFLASLWCSPFSQITFKVAATSPEVEGYVNRALKRFQRMSAPSLLQSYFWWGYAPGGVEWKCRGSSGATCGRWHIDRVRRIMPQDARPLTWRKGGRFAGFKTPTTRPIISPYAFWFCGHEIAGPLYDDPPVSGAYDDWKEYVSRGGARHLQLLYMRKMSIRPSTMLYPSGTTPIGASNDETPQRIDNQALALATLEKIEAGANVALPSERDDKGNLKWELQSGSANPDASGVRDYPDWLKKNMAAGVGIPLEVVQAAETGSGWSGRKVPYKAWLCAVDVLGGMFYHAFDTQALRQGVWEAFGPKADYEFVTESLAEKVDQEEGGGQGGQQPPGQPGQPPAGGGGGVPPGMNPYSGPAGGQGYTDPRTGRTTYMSDIFRRGVAAADRKGQRELAARQIAAAAMLQLQEQAHLEGDPAKYQDECDAIADLAADPKELFAVLGGKKTLEMSAAGGRKKPLSCVMIDLTGDAKELQRKAVGLIRDGDLADDGAEEDPHVTVRFGLHEQGPDELKEAFGYLRPITGFLTGYGSFQSPDYDVLFLSVESDGLKALNAMLGFRPNTQTHPEYKPHATIAYLKPGLAEHYIKELPPVGRVPFRATEIVFSNDEKTKWYLPLTGNDTGIEMGWTAAVSKTGRTMAVGTDVQAGRKLYGKRAMQALGAHERRERQTATVGRAAHLTSRVMNGEVTADELAELADHLPALPLENLRYARAKMGASFGRHRRKKEMVDQLVWHVRNMHAEETGGQAPERPAQAAKPAAVPEPAKPAVDIPADGNTIEAGDKPKKPRKKAATGDLLSRVVASYGGLDIDGEFKKHFSDKADAKEHGVQSYVFKKGGLSLDQMATELQAAGHIVVPEGQDAGEHLLQKLAKRAKSAYADLTKEYDKALQDHYKALEDAKGYHDEREIDARTRDGEEAGRVEAQAGDDADAWEEFGSIAEGEAGGAEVDFDPDEFAKGFDDPPAGTDADPIPLTVAPKGKR